jgi:predicted GNAT family acetyltransferase
MPVEHDIEHHRFLVQRPEGKGELLYRRLAPRLIDLLHTEVSPGLRGQGVADALAAAAIAFARDSGEKIIPTCPFVQKWLARHPEAADLVGQRPPR